MYQIRTVASWEELLSLTPPVGACAPMPSMAEWLSPDHIGLVAVGADGPVGAILLTPCRQVANVVTKFRLNWLLVMPNHRNQGVGRRLAQAAAAEAANRGAHSIQISLKPENDHCISWCEMLPKVPGVGFVLSLDRCGGF